MPCNSIQCAGCEVWFNWATLRTSSSKAGTLSVGPAWQPGEREYQMSLPEKEKKELLERNGIEYDPNYVRLRNR